MERYHRRLGEAIGAAAALALLLAGCGSSVSVSAISGAMAGTSASAVLQARADETPVDPAIVTADNGFGLKLLNTLISGAGGNVAISPLSVSLALQVLYNGAAGSTQQAMSQTLELGPLDTQQLNDDNAGLQASLIDPDPNVQLAIANSLWIDQAEYPVQSTFIQTDQTYYAATIGDLAGAPANVNAWVDSKTEGLIAQILPPNLPPSEFRIAILANVLYFKGSWTTSFDSTQTAPAPFLTGGTQVSAQMMRQTGPFDYFQGTQQGTSFQAVRIPYGQGRMSMLVVLPTAGTNLTSFLAGLDAGTLASWNAKFQSTQVALQLPRFTASYQASLAGALTSLGMGVVFTPREADLSALAPGATVSYVAHATQVEVDETGTVAAAATVVTVTPTVALPAPAQMVMDHPFFYAIQDDATGALLFVGVMMNPAQT
jgi:serine protease inhibitor